MKGKPTVSDDRWDVAVRERQEARMIPRFVASAPGWRGHFQSCRRGCRKASLGDLCGMPSCFGSIKLEMVPKPILHKNPNVSPAPVQALCKRQRKPLRGFAEAPAGIRCRTQRAAEANGRIEAEHKSLPREEGGLACQALGPHTGSRPGGSGPGWISSQLGRDPTPTPQRRPPSNLQLLMGAQLPGEGSP